MQIKADQNLPAPSFDQLLVEREYTKIHTNKNLDRLTVTVTVTHTHQAQPHTHGHKSISANVSQQKDNV